MNPPDTDVSPPAAEWPDQPIRRDRWDRARGLAGKTPSWIFDLILLLPLLGLLYSRSFPGSDVNVTVGSGLLLVVLGIIWIVRAVGYLTARRAGRAEGGAGALAVAPIITVAALALFFLAVPLQVRWSMSKSDFETWTQKAHAAPAGPFLPPTFGVAHHIGAYDITRIERSDQAVLFHERTGDFLGSAGFAYLPNGPTAQATRVLNQPHFRHLEGAWYAWTAK